MNSEHLFDAIGMAEDEMVQKAGHIKKKFWRKKHFYGAVAAVLVVSLGLGVLWKAMEPSDSVLKAYAMAEAVYPKMSEMPSEDEFLTPDGEWDDEAWGTQYDAWKTDKEAQLAYFDEAIDLTSFYKESISEFLSGEDGENVVFSPLNLYMALAMLAETAEGNCRAQILSLLGCESIEQLRKDVVGLWNSNYSDDGALTCILANSLWLNESVEFKRETMDLLANTYYASSYRGNPTTEQFNQALREWLNEQTGGLLKNMVENVQMDTEMILALASTVYFKAKWTDEFRENNTESDTFYAAEGEITCDFMKESTSDTYYWGEHFSAAEKRFQGYRGRSSMWFILPDEGVSPEELLADEETMEFLLSDGDWSNSKFLTINLAVPKFDVQSQIDLTDGLQNLGVTDAFDRNRADFSPVTEMPLCVTSATHGARVCIDEEGCTAAAFTVLMDAGSAMPPEEEVDFILNRPFLFVITSEVGMPLFVGIVNTP